MGFHLPVWSSGRSPPPTPPIRPHLPDQKIHSSAKTTNLRAQDALWRVCNHCRLTLQSSAVRRGRWGERHKSGLGWVCFATQTGAINELPRHAPWFLPGHPCSWAHPSFLSREWPPTGGGAPTAISLGRRWGAIWSQASRARSGLGGSIGPAWPTLHLTQRRYGIPVVPRSFLGGGEYIFTGLPPRLTWASGGEKREEGICS